MKIMGLCVCLVLAAAFCSRAAGEGDGTPRVEDDSSLDPELLKEVEQAEDSDLDAALERGAADAKTSAAQSQALMFGVRADMAGALADLRTVVKRTDDPRPGSMEDDADQLLLAVQMLESKTADFLKKSAKADLRVPDAKEEDLVRRRAGYRAADRQKDLKLAEKYVRSSEARLARMKKNADKVVPGQNALQALAAYDAFLGEVRSGRGIALGLSSKLAAAGPDARGYAAAANKMGQRIDALDKDLLELGIERRLLEASLKLACHDAASFDRTR